MNNKKSVLYLRTDIYYSELKAGGSVTHTIGVLKGFLHHHYELIIASCPLFEQYQFIAHQLIQLKNPPWLRIMRWKLNCLLSTIFFTYQILKNFPKAKPTLLYQRYSILNCTGIIISKIKKIPLMLEYNGSEVWVDAHWSKEKNKIRFSWLIAWIENLNLRHATFITVVSDVLKKELIRRGISAEKIIVNCNGVDTSQFNPARLWDARNQLRQHLNLQKEFVFGFVGTFSAWHGIGILAEIIPALIQKNDRVRFLLIGDGQLRQWLENQLLSCLSPQDFSKVFFTGIIKPENIADYLSACDAFICPTQPNPDKSEFFGSPTKLFEYLSMAKPIIASNIGQIRDILQPALEIEKIKSYQNLENTIGILVNPTTSTSFITAAQRLLQLSDQQLQQIGSNARKKAETEYQWHDQVKKMISFMEV